MPINVFGRIALGVLLLSVTAGAAHAQQYGAMSEIEVRLTFTGFRSLYANCEQEDVCPGLYRGGTDVVEGVVRTVDGSDPSDDEVVYQGVLKRRTHLGICDAQMRDGAEDQHDWCVMVLSGTEDVEVTVSVGAQEGEGATVRMTPVPGTVSVSVTGGCSEPGIQSGWRDDYLKTDSVTFSTVPAGSLRRAARYREQIGSGSCEWVLDVRPVDDLELVVDPQSYETWRPEALFDESTIGSEIKIDAKLQRPDGSAAKVKARRIIFELTDTSREPGIAMNFPIAGGATAFDLQFSPDSNARPGYIISGAGNQRLETMPGEHVDASAVVSSYDWGGWSTLKVTAELRDGRVVTGHLKGKREMTQIPLPKRANDSLIADIWKENAGAMLPDKDDSETGPAGESSPGDGFSLYEEYRGFYADSKHVSGHPKKIDFFVRNYIGADARPGIYLFGNLTGAEVHDRLNDDEFDREKRVMNVNHGEGAHLVDQHGVFLETQPTLHGGLTVLSKAGVRGRPVITMSVNLQPRDSLTSIVTSENVPASDLAFAYDRAVAHELMHSVGAEHHGQGDGQATFFFVYGDDPVNATGKSYFRFPMGGGAVTIIDEASGRDLASVREGDMMLAREQSRPFLYPDMLVEARKALAARQGYNIPWTAEQLAEHDLDFSIANSLMPTWYVGAEHGESSGNELCVMRYYFARLYEKKGGESSFYFITDRGSEHAGLDLCRLAVGTGVNDKQRQPQPRYGDAAVGRGVCSDSIIFNDALPLKPDAVAEGPQQ